MAKAIMGDTGPSKAEQRLLAAQTAQIKKQSEPQGALAPSPMVQEAEAVRRARLAAMNRAGRDSTIKTAAASVVTPAYSNRILGQA